VLGYHIARGGEAEDSANAQKKLADSIPIFFGMVILAVNLWFDAYKETLIIRKGKVNENKKSSGFLFWKKFYQKNRAF